MKWDQTGKFNVFLLVCYLFIFLLEIKEKPINLDLDVCDVNLFKLFLENRDYFEGCAVQVFCRNWIILIEPKLFILGEQL
jgi:hypothetical protein